MNAMSSKLSPRNSCGLKSVDVSGCSGEEVLPSADSSAHSRTCKDMKGERTPIGGDEDT
jgi:hypothetical protein